MGTSNAGSLADQTRSKEEMHNEHIGSTNRTKTNRGSHHESNTETVQLLGVTEGCVKIRLLRARLQMRDALTPTIDASWATGRVEFEKVRPL